jgi:hypothetical protein
MSNELQESELDQVTGGADWTAPTTDRSKPGAPANHPPPQPRPQTPFGDYFRSHGPEMEPPAPPPRKIPSQRF